MTKSCKLYPRIPAGVCAVVDIAALLQPGNIGALLITDLVGSGVPREAIGACIAAAGSQNVAVLIENDAALAKELDADGVHLRDHSQSVEEIRKTLGGGKEVGISCPLSRHDAMVAGEQGASYVAFGEGAADGLDETAAMVRWWDELFEIPCVGWGHEGLDEESLRTLIRAGADFLSVPVSRAAAGVAQEIARYARLCADVGMAD